MVGVEIGRSDSRDNYSRLISRFYLGPNLPQNFQKEQEQKEYDKNLSRLEKNKEFRMVVLRKFGKMRNSGNRPVSVGKSLCPDTPSGQIYLMKNPTSPLLCTIPSLTLEL